MLPTSFALPQGLKAAILQPMKTIPNNWLLVELHLHTNASGDSLIEPQQVIDHCRQVGIDRVAITDHNSIAGALTAKALAPEMVIIGEEIETTQGELLGYYLREGVPAGLAPMEAIKRLRAQGAVISVSHPFDHTRGPRWTYDQLTAIAPHVDALEIFNARCFSNKPNRQAAEFARQQGLPGTAGSDAHSFNEIGRAALHVPSFNHPESFLAALQQAQPQTRLSPAWVHLSSQWAKLVRAFQKK